MMFKHYPATLLLGAGLLLGQCTSGAIDPTVVTADIKTACQILVSAAQIAEMLKLDPTMSASAIVSLVCSGFTASQAAASKEAAKAPLAAGQTVDFPVVIKGQPVTIHATKA